MNTATPTPSSATATDQPTSTESPSPVASLSPSPTPVVTATTSPLPTATLSPTPIPSLTPSPIVIPTQLAVDVAKLNAALKTSPPFTSELPPGEHSPLVAGQTGTDVVGTFYPLDSFAGDVDGLGYTVFPSAEEAAAAFSDALLEAGVYVGSVRFPVVPRGEARLRAQPSAAHSAADIDEALATFERIGKRLAII